MKLNISIDYHTQWGQSLYIVGSTPELGNWSDDQALLMTCQPDGRTWIIELSEVNGSLLIEYSFLLKENGIVVRRESAPFHRLIASHQHTITIKESWQEEKDQKYFQTSAFTVSFFAHKEVKSVPYYQKTLLFLVDCPYVDASQELLLLGDASALGLWDADKSLRFNYIGNSKWQLALDASILPDKFEYKLAIYDTQKREIVFWEKGDNRIGSNQVDLYAVKCEPIRFEYTNLHWKAAGVAIPVFSLRSKDSFGIGDFEDLHKMVDWAVASGQKVIQILPINDTTITYTWTDSYPYSAISIYALHPLYLGLKKYPLRNKKLYSKLMQDAKELNSLDALDYDRVAKCKIAYLQELFKEIGTLVLGESGFHDFYETNKEWLFPYACFCYLRDKNKTTNIGDWGEFKMFDREKLEDYIGRDLIARDAVRFAFFVQYLLHKQLVEVKRYANSKGVILKGDIPIGIDKNSVEAWTEPHLFNLDVQAGAPPDAFSKDGQNWGFPTYNWGEMAKDNYQWWKKRFRKMADYFDAYRIDHILGFFRIWEIPSHSVQGLLGYFSPALPLSKEEIESRGFSFDEQMTLAKISFESLISLFGEYVDEVTDKYLDALPQGEYKLKENVDTQRKIVSLLYNIYDEKEQFIRKGLLHICNEVLFIRDKKENAKYHPRISVQHSFRYNELAGDQRHALNLLYDDFYYYRHTEFWKDEAMKKLPSLIGATSMLVCGEDLGMIPDCVPDVMKELQILSLEIERMPKERGVDFTELPKLPYLSVCTTSTHDMSPIRLWWKEDRVLTQKYYNDVLLREGDTPEDCSSDICWQILNNHLCSPAMLCIIPLQDWLSYWDDIRCADIEAERINIPANPKHYWRYRMHLTIEDLLRNENYNQSTKMMIIDSGR